MAIKVMPVLRGSWIAALGAISMSTSHVELYHNMWYDTGSGPVGIDNQCTACLSHKINNFDGPLVDIQSAVRGFDGSKETDVKKRTLVWCCEDDES